MKNYTITVNGKVYEVTVEEGFSTGRGQVSGVSETPQEEPKKTAPKGMSAGTAVKAPMPGKILDIRVNLGQAVKQGEILFILEAMKMENEIVAPCDGTVGSVQVTVGASVESSDVLTVLN